MSQKFGGDWTETKLDIVEMYLKPYVTIMRGNAKAQHFRITYVDGFAGSGRRYSEPGEVDQQLFQDLAEAHIERSYAGSVERALSIEPPFDHYIFIEKNQSYVADLEEVIKGYPARQKQVSILQEDTNVAIPQWCSSLGSKDRGVVFLDPYGMQVNWSTINALALTRKVDLWILVPLGQAVIRLLTKRAPPPPEWAKRLTSFLGEDSWREHFYEHSRRPTLFEEEDFFYRDADYNKITQYMVKRFMTIFPCVLEQPVILRNRKGLPLYLLCFAASNPKAAALAKKLATDITKRYNDGQ